MSEQVVTFAAVLIIGAAIAVLIAGAIAPVVAQLVGLIP